jgi:hypothetical protein
MENTNMFEPRWYRSQMKSELESFTVTFLETDLWIGVNHEAYTESFRQDCQSIAQSLYNDLKNYLLIDPGYQHALTPYSPILTCPAVAAEMARAALKANVGPMAAVAGAFAQEIGVCLERKYPISDLIIENGGDIYLRTTLPRHITIWAGTSVLSDKLCIEIIPEQSPLGVCTSSGTVGHSLSFGRADAVTVLAKNTAVADAYATAIGNMIISFEDIKPALEYCATQPEIAGVIIIVGDRIGMRGNVKLVKKSCI